MTAITRHALRVYSSVAVLKGDGADVLDALVPFFLPILKLMDGKIYEPNLLAAGVRKMYRWHFTNEVAEHFIPRLVAQKLLTEHREGGRATYVVSVPDLDDSASEKLISELIDEVVNEFYDYSQSVSDLFTYFRSIDELTDILLRFVVDDQFGLTNTNGAYKNTDEEGSDANSLLEKIEDGGRPLSNDDRYIAASFVAHVANNKPQLLPHLSRLAAVGLLAEVVEDFVRPTAQAAQVQTTIVLDAPLALDYLGLSGKAVKSNVRTVFDALTSIGCKLVVFPITCSEMSRNLESMLNRPPERRDGPTHQALLRREIMKEYVQAVAANPEAALAAEGIEVRSIDMASLPSQHKYFDNSLYEDFFSSIGWVQDVNPREHDATCLALIMRLRNGKHSSDIFRCPYTFATQNARFAKRSRNYCLENRLIYSQQEGPVVHQRELATVAWLRTGLGGKQEIPSKQLIAHCDRVLTLRPEVANAVKERLAAITPESIGQFDLLLLDQRSVRKLADATLNDATVVTGENAGQLLDLMKEAAIAEKAAEYEQKLEHAKAEHKRQRLASRMEAQKALEARDLEIEKQRRNLERLEQERARLKQQQSDALSALLTSINRRLTIAERLSTATVVLVASAGAFAPLVGYGTSAVGWMASAVFTLVALYFLVADILHWPKLGLKSVLRRYAVRVFGRECRERGLSHLGDASLVFEEGRAAQIKEISVPTDVIEQNADDLERKGQ